MKRILVLSILITCIFAFAAEPVLVWDRTYNTGENEMANAVAVDQAGNVFVAGQVSDGIHTDALIVAYDAGGNVLWNDVYDGGFGDDHYRGVAIDNQGYIYVAGSTYNGTDMDMLIVKYNPSGDTVWTFVDDVGLPTTEWDNEFFGIAVDEVNVYATGYYNNETTDVIWTRILDKEDASYVMIRGYDSGDDDRGLDIAVDADGYAYVAGYSGHNYRIIKYDQNLDTIWTEIYDAGDEDKAYGIALDEEGCIYCSGVSGPDLNAAYYTMRCNNNGNFVWGEEYDTYETNWGRDVAVDFQGIYVTGMGRTISPTDTFAHPVTICYDRDGNTLWETTYEDEYGGGRGIYVDSNGFMYLTGMIANLLTNSTDMLTLKYELVEDVVTEQPLPSLVTLDIVDNLSSSPTIHYSLPQGRRGTLIFYSADGRKLESYTLDPNQSSFTWDVTHQPSGVYFARLVVGNKSITAKAVLIR